MQYIWGTYCPRPLSLSGHLALLNRIRALSMLDSVHGERLAVHSHIVDSSLIQQTFE
jgi:hypothetical protein